MVIKKEDLKKIKLKKVSKTPITATIDSDLENALRKISRNSVPFSFAIEHILMHGMFFYVEENKRLEEKIEEFKKKKINATIDDNLLKKLNSIKEKSKVSFSFVINYILRLGFIHLLNSKTNEIKILEEEKKGN